MLSNCETIEIVYSESMNLKEIILNSLSSRLNLGVEIFSPHLQRQDNTPKHGQFTLRCFALEKYFPQKTPAQIASFIAETLRDNPGLSVLADGPYLNFTFDPKHLAREVFAHHPQSLIPRTAKNIGPVVIDFSSPNIAKPFHLGHLRSTILGNALRNLYNFSGYPTVAINHLGDWGTQFGMLILAWKKFGQGELTADISLQKLFELYVRIHAEMEDDPSINAQAREWFLKLENGDPEAQRLWEVAKEVSLKEFSRIYERLGITFDAVVGESFYIPLIKNLEEQLQKKNILKESEGARIIDLGESLPPLIFRKSDGSTIYDTRDLAAAMYRHEKYNFSQMLYLVGTPQALHFKQLFAALRSMGEPWWKDCIHIDFGHTRLPEGGMSTRKGRVVLLEDVLNESVAKVKNIIEEKNPSLPHKDQIAEEVGVGAIIFYDLERQRTKDYVFDWSLMLNFEGHSGPFVQYTYARIQSLLAKTQSYGTTAIPDGVFDDASINLFLALDAFSETISEALTQYQPSILAQYLLSLADAFNSFYEKNRIEGSTQPVAASRRMLAQASGDTLRVGLSILGIKTPSEL